jgi:hypothetical protein
MKLTEIGGASRTKKLNRVMESRFGFAIDYANLTTEKAQRLVKAIGESLATIRASHGVHTAEKNPKYMEMLLVKEGLDSWLSNASAEIVAEETVVTESETAKSEAILAARDIVDSMQDMMERVGKMQNEQMPALLDAIRDQIGMEQADAFKAAVAPMLDTLAQSLQQSREGADQAARALAGEQVAPTDMALPGAEVAGELPAPTSDLDTEEPADEFAATDAAAGGDEEIGRERR